MSAPFAQKERGHIPVAADRGHVQRGGAENARRLVDAGPLGDKNFRDLEPPFKGCRVQGHAPDPIDFVDVRSLGNELTYPCDIAGAGGVMDRAGLDPSRCKREYNRDE